MAYRYVAIRDDAPEPAAKFERKQSAETWVRWRQRHHPRESWTIYPLLNPTHYPAKAAR